MSRSRRGAGRHGAARWAGVSRSAILGSLAAGGFAFAGVALAGGCGARTGLEVPLPDPPPPDCLTFEDCRGAADYCFPVGCEVEELVREEDGLRYLVGTCVELPPVDCDDDDECTIDSCRSVDGTCRHTPATIDADGDGFDGPRAGFQAGDPGSCGDDCDDTSELAYPGALEVCDGVDNDCNRIVDDGATWIPLELEPIQLSNEGAAPAEPGGVAWSGESWLAFFTISNGGDEAVRSLLAPDGGETSPADERITAVNSDSYAGSVLWIGDRYATAWGDRRDADYEIYFGLFAPNGDKITPDTRLSVASGFSLYPEIGWTGQEFVVVWQDERMGNGMFGIYGQRLDIDGVPIGENVVLEQAEFNGAEAPSVAASTLGVGITYGLGDSIDRRIAFKVFGPDLTPRSETILLTDGTRQTRWQAVAANNDEYVVTWADETEGSHGIWGAVLDQDGAIVVEPRRVIDPGPGNHARYPTVRALGDRVLIVYSDDRAGDGYEIWATLLDDRLGALEAERQVTFAPNDSVKPRTTFGPDGTLGVLFRDDRSGEQHVWFTRLGCAVDANPEP